jgi:GntR family transcriptional regulator
MYVLLQDAAEAVIANVKRKLWDGDERLPLFERLRDAIAQRVRAAEWAPGEALPAELTLAEEYGVSLGTIRRAIGSLVDSGALERRQGSGTFVRTGDFSSTLFRFFRLQGPDGAPIRPEGRLVSRDVERADSRIAAALALRPGDEIIRMTRVRLSGGEPLLAEDIAVPLAPFRPFLDIPANELGPLLYPVYARVCGRVVARAEETITFDHCPAVEARLLGLKTGDPVVAIERVARDFDGAACEWRRRLGPASRFHYRVEIR